MKKLVVLAIAILIVSQIVIGLYRVDSDKDGIADAEDPFPNDYDNDGMPDDYENEHGLRFGVNDAKLDPDNDGLSNIMEYNLNTNLRSADSDNDGINDKEEVDQGSNPLDPRSPSRSNAGILLIIGGALIVIILIFILRKPISGLFKRPKQEIPSMKPKPVMKPTLKKALPTRKFIPIKEMKKREEIFKKFEKPVQKAPVIAPSHKELALKLKDFKQKGYKSEHASQISKLVEKSNLALPVKKDVFEKLSKLTSKLPMKEKEDVFNELSDKIKKKKGE